MKNYDIINLAKQIQSASPEILNDRVEQIEKEMSMYAVTGDFPDVITFIELMMISQRCMELANVELTQEEQNDEYRNPVCWMVIPMGDDKKYWLNGYGRREWVNVTETDGKPISTVERAYYWIDRVLILDSNRKVIKDMPFSEFIKTEIDHYNPVMPDVNKYKNQVMSEEEK